MTKTDVMTETLHITDTKILPTTVTNTNTVVESMILTKTDTIKETLTDVVTKTDIKVIPTTYTSIWVKTDVIDRVSYTVTRWPKIGAHGQPLDQYRRAHSHFDRC